MALVGCLDTRFYFAHSAEEAWTKKVVSEASQRGSIIVSSTVTISELLSTMGTSVGLETTRIRINGARMAGVSFVPVTEKLAMRAGEMTLKQRDLPLGDAVIAATALEFTQGRVYTDDPHFDGIPGISSIWQKR